MVSITQGYNRSCKSSIGGVKKVYFFSFVKYARSLITLNSNVLTSFPTTIIYDFDGFESGGFSESMQEDDGGKFVSQKIDLTFKNSGLNFLDFQKLLFKDIRLIIEDYNGNKRILGLYNGLEVTNLKSDIGTSKSSLNGFNLSVEGNELISAPFINDLNDAGFTISGTEETFYRITQNGDLRITQNNNNRITQNG